MKVRIQCYVDGFVLLIKISGMCGTPYALGSFSWQHRVGSLIRTQVRGVRALRSGIRTTDSYHTRNTLK